MSTSLCQKIRTPFDSIESFDPCVLTILDSYLEDRVSLFETHHHYYLKFGLSVHVDKAFFNAVALNNFEVVQAILSSGSSWKSKQLLIVKHSYNAFSLAVLHGYFKLAKYFVSLVKDEVMLKSMISYRNFVFYRVASDKRHFDLVMYITSLFLKYDIPLFTYPVRSMISSGKSDLLKTFLLLCSKKGAEPIFRSIHRGEWIVYASKHGHREIVEYLFSMGNYCRTQNKKAFSKASKYGHIEVLRYFVSIGIRRGFLDEAVFDASKRGHLDVVRYLISLDLNCNYDLEYRRSMLIALQYGHTEIVNFFTSLGVDPISGNENGIFPLLNS